MTMEAIQPAQANPALDPGAYLETASSLVCDGDPGEEMAALMVENGEAERTAAHQERETEEAAQQQADAAQVQAMHDEASSLRGQGVFDAATAVVGACIDVACPVATAGAGATSAASAGAVTEGLVARHATDGVEKLGDGLWKAAQHDDEANAAADKASADQHASAAKDASDAASDANATLAAALDFDRNYTSIEAQTQLATLHRA
jgi:hypothetical protein